MLSPKVRWWPVDVGSVCVVTPKNRSGLADQRGDKRVLPHFPIAAGPVTLNASSSASPFHGSEASQTSRPNTPQGGEALMPQDRALREAGGLFDVSSGPAPPPAPQPPSGGRPRPPSRSCHPSCWPPSCCSWARPALPHKGATLPGPGQAAAPLGSLSPSLRVSVFPVLEPCTACTESTSGSLRWISALLLYSVGGGVGTGRWVKWALENTASRVCPAPSTAWARPGDPAVPVIRNLPQGLQAM